MSSVFNIVSRYYEICAIEYSENKVIMQSGLSENWIGPGILESSVFEQIVTCCLVFDGVLVVWNSCRVMIVEHLIEALQVQPRFRNSL